MHANNSANSKLSVCDPDHQEDSYKIGITLRAPRPSSIVPYLDHARDIQLSARSATHAGRSQLFHRRIGKRNRVDINLACSWLRLSLEYHRQYCEGSNSDEDGTFPSITPEHLTVTGDHNMCLCRLPGGNG